MRIAVVSDIHGNLTAFDAVLADLRETSPDLIFHGGDLADWGSGPAEILDRIRDLGWPGVVGNTDEMLFDPRTLEEFARTSSAPGAIWDAVREMAAATRDVLGEERIEWLRGLPRAQEHASVALVHASPASRWVAPGSGASDTELESEYGPLDKAVVVYGHIHVSYIRKTIQRTIVNSGSVSLPYDGDPRASYVLLDGETAAIKKVAYDVDREIRAVKQNRMPHWDWVARMLRSARPELP